MQNNKDQSRFESNAEIAFGIPCLYKCTLTIFNLLFGTAYSLSLTIVFISNEIRNHEKKVSFQNEHDKMIHNAEGCFFLVGMLRS